MHLRTRLPRLGLRGGSLVAVIAVVAVVSIRDDGVSATASQARYYQFDGEDRLIRPTGYREWVYVGTPLTPNELNPPEAPFPEFHNVYIDPLSWEHYKETGKFRNGTILIKELVSVGSKAATSGTGYFMGEFVGLEATIKDYERFPDEPGNWAYFSFGHAYPLADVAEMFPAAACNACHEAAAQEDWVFTQYYPVLRAGRGTNAAGAPMTEGSASYQEVSTAMSGRLEAAKQPTADTTSGSTDSVVPIDTAALHQYLKDGRYKSFPARESGMHPSRGPHSKLGWPVRVYIDDKADASLKAGGSEHPVGTSLVKEMFTEDGELQGWAVMVKTQDDSAGGRGWFWYESTNVDDPSDIVAAGNGVPLCFGCHSIGNDFVLTDYPLQ